MNWSILISGLFAAFTTICHFAIGTKLYLQPMLSATFDTVARKVMHCVFHYVSAFLIISSLVLLGTGLGINLGGDAPLMVRVLALNYAAFAIVQLVLALTSEIEKPLIKMFQWTFFVLIAVFAFIGA